MGSSPQPVIMARLPRFGAFSALVATIVIAVISANGIDEIVPEVERIADIVPDSEIPHEDAELLELQDPESEMANMLEGLQTALSSALRSKGQHSMRPQDIHRLLYGKHRMSFLSSPKKESAIAKSYRAVYGEVLPTKESRLAALKALEHAPTDYATKPIDKEQIAWSGMFKSCCDCGKRYIDKFNLPIGGRPICEGIQALSTKGTKCVYEVADSCPSPPKPKPPKSVGSGSAVRVAAGSASMLATGLLQAEWAK